MPLQERSNSIGSELKDPELVEMRRSSINPLPSRLHISLNAQYYYESSALTDMSCTCSQCKQLTYHAAVWQVEEGFEASQTFFKLDNI